MLILRSPGPQLLLRRMQVDRWKPSQLLIDASVMSECKTTGRREHKSGEHRLVARCFRQLAESRDGGIGQFCTRRSWSVISSRWSAQRRCAAFTLAELLVSVGVLVLLVLLATQLLNSAATITTLGHKKMDADSQARQVLDRMAIDFAQMIKRSDVDYYLKSSAAPPLRNVPQPGNDQIAFYSAVPGYYPADNYQSPVSLVAYRVNGQNRLEKMSKGLRWNAASNTDTPVVFIPIPVSSPLPTPELPVPTPAPPTPAPAWPQAGNQTADPDYEVIGSQVFRFEYCYLLKGGVAPGSGTYGAILTGTPWVGQIGHTAPSGMQDVSAIVVDITVIDPRSKTLLSGADISALAAQLIDW